MKSGLLSKLTLALWVCLVSWTLVAQQSPKPAGAVDASNTVPRLINYSGVLKDVNGKPLSGVVGITFLFYKDEQGAAPLWIETQNVAADANGRYTITLGSTTAEGLPADLFANGEARWLGVQAEGQAELPRVLLVAVPYALKAADAETVGGLPPSAFVLAVPAAGPGTAASVSPASSVTAAPGLPPTTSNVTTTGGTVNTLPLWTTTTNIQSSVVTQSGSGSSAKIGINTTSPSATLDVKGGTNIEGLLDLPATGAATSSAGKNSQVQDFVASSFSSSTAKAVNQTFQWRAEPAGNNTSTPSATLNLLFGSGTTTPTETGLKVSSTGLFTFATGQTFPGAGTITGVTAGTALTGGGSSGNVTLNLDTTKVPLLNTANTFVGNQTITGNVSDTGNITTTGAVTGLTGNFGSMSLSGTIQAADGTFPLLMNSVTCCESGNRMIWAHDPKNPNWGVYYDDNVDNMNWRTVAGGEFLTADFPLQRIGVGTTSPTDQLSVVSLFSTVKAVTAQGFTAPSGSAVSGTDAVVAIGGNGDPNNPANGGLGVEGVGGNAGCNGSACGGGAGAGVLGVGGLGSDNGVLGADGVGGSFTGGNSSSGVFGDGIDALAGSGVAGNFFGDIDVTGAIIAGTKDFKIDHPLDPANKYLVHSSVESSEMMNIYTGNVTTDAQGAATVQLPEWFEVLNTDFRYQLTVIGVFAQAIVSREIQNDQLEIRTNLPNVKVSWQVTGVRQDVYAKAHPLVVEEEKDARLKGFYIHPELYGAPDEKQIEWARHPQMMKRIKEVRAKQIAESHRQQPTPAR